MNIDFSNRKALVRVDFNVPLSNGTITDDTRMQAALPTIEHILNEGGSVILMSHLGRPQKKTKDDGSLDVDAFTMRQLVPHLSELLGREVEFASDVAGDDSRAKAAALQPGEVLLIENTRFEAGEGKGDAELAKRMADLADVYVNDAFGTAHRAHASTTTVAEYFGDGDKTFGLLLRDELKNAQRIIDEPTSPYVAIVGGAKVSDKIGLIEQLLTKVDKVIIGGGMAYTFFKAQGGDIGDSLVEMDKLDMANLVLKKAAERHVEIYLPKDSIIANAFAADADTDTALSHQIPDGWMGLDIGEQARADYRAVLSDAKTILWNGPMGVFEMEAFSHGTSAVAHAVAEATQNGAYSLIGGGDSVAAINKNNLADQVSYVSTGGGAMLELLEGKELPGVKAIRG